MDSFVYKEPIWPDRHKSVYYVEPVKDVATSAPLSEQQGACLRKAIENSANIREKGFNRGPEVEELQRYTGNKPGQPYCGSGVCKLEGDCGIENPRSGWAQTVALYGRVVYRRSVTSAPLSNRSYPKEIRHPLVLGIHNGKRISHTGFALQTDGKMTRTGEFNTSGSRKNYGTRDGDGFHFLYRDNRQIYSLSDHIEK
jgi:hypothetical protein